ncbi:MAG TPA: T9SS type A sorting domain-containing protein, partial [Bacteroidales bacterium]|nr:T9SS type A sorting domain-containing protein [Bacteroidales bacterium]
NTTFDSAGVFLARSADGGHEWKEYEISDHNYKPEPIGGLGQGYQGDNIDLTSTEKGLWPVWMDNSTGIYQIWTTSVEFSGLDNLEENTGIKSPVILGQNRPNPFSEKTTIWYTLERKERVIVRIYDRQGCEIACVLNASKDKGTHSLVLGRDSFNGKAGIYFYTLTAGRTTLSKKLLLLP